MNRLSKDRTNEPGTRANVVARRTRRTLLSLLAALALSFVLGWELGLGNDELLGYLLASLTLVVGSGLVALMLFGVIRLFRR